MAERSRLEMGVFMVVIIQCNSKVFDRVRQGGLFGSREGFSRRGVTSGIENLRKDARGRGRVGESSERRKVSMETFHKKRIGSDQVSRFWG